MKRTNKEDKRLYFIPSKDNSWIPIDMEILDIQESFKKARVIIRKVYLLLGFLLGLAVMGIVVTLTRVFSLLLRWYFLTW